MHQELSGFATRLRDHIRPEGKAVPFERLALELFSLQFQNNPAYQKICEARGMTPFAGQTLDPHSRHTHCDIQGIGADLSPADGTRGDISFQRHHRTKTQPPFSQR